MTTEIQNSLPDPDRRGSPGRPTGTWILMRHAKSDWGDAGLSDHDRPLNDRGRRDAPAMADYLADLDALPDLILCSSAKRTRQTADLMLARWKKTGSSGQPLTTSPQRIVDDSLYLASGEAILNQLCQHDAEGRRLMVLAHNPGISHLVSHLDNHYHELPTAAVAIFDRVAKPDGDVAANGLAMNWTLRNQMRPKALPDRHPS